MLSHWNWTVDEDLAFYDREGVEVIGLSLAKMQAAGGWEQYVDRVRDGGYRVGNLIGLGPIPWSNPAGRADSAPRVGQVPGRKFYLPPAGHEHLKPFQDSQRRRGQGVGAM